VRIATASERRDLLGPAWERTRDTLPEYNNHGDVLNEYWPRLTEELPEFQFHLVSDEDEILARARSIPLRWDDTIADLPAGIDGAIMRGFDEGDANVLCALIIMVPRDLQGRGLSAAAVEGMAAVARRHGLASLIAPVRPSWKERYPLVEIARYAEWRRPDGLLFDPWMRVHERLGAEVLKSEPRSLRITGSVGEWEGWTGMTFPESGNYWFPGGLATVAVDRECDQGS
jgi:GNAT superfamily N-acetyltransferase